MDIRKHVQEEMFTTVFFSIALNGSYPNFHQLKNGETHCGGFI